MSNLTFPQQIQILHISSSTNKLDGDDRKDKDCANCHTDNNNDNNNTRKV